MSAALPSLAPAAGGAASCARRPQRLDRIGFSNLVYGEIADFVALESHILDDGRLEDWLGLLDPEIFYWAPVRTTVGRGEGSGFHPGMAIFFDDLSSLKTRIHRVLNTKSAFAEDPPSRTRRVAGSLLVYATEQADEFAVDTSLILLRSRGDVPGPYPISAKREDLLRRTAEGWRLLQRTILVDEAVMATPNLAIFL